MLQNKLDRFLLENIMKEFIIKESLRLTRLVKTVQNCLFGIGFFWLGLGIFELVAYEKNYRGYAYLGATFAAWLGAVLVNSILTELKQTVPVYEKLFDIWERRNGSK